VTVIATIVTVITGIAGFTGALETLWNQFAKNFPEAHESIKKSQEDRRVMEILTTEHHSFNIKALHEYKWFDIDHDGERDDLVVVYEVDLPDNDDSMKYADVFLQHDKFNQIAFHELLSSYERNNIDYLLKDDDLYLILSTIGGSGRFLSVGVFTFHDSGSFEKIYETPVDMGHSDGLLIITGNMVRIRDASDEYRLIIADKRARLEKSTVGELGTATRVLRIQALDDIWLDDTPLSVTAQCQTGDSIGDEVLPETMSISNCDTYVLVRTRLVLGLHEQLLVKSNLSIPRVWVEPQGKAVIEKAKGITRLFKPTRSGVSNIIMTDPAHYYLETLVEVR